MKASLLMSQREFGFESGENGLWHYAVYGRIIPLEEIIEWIEAISIEDIKSTLLKILLNEKLPTVAAIGKIKKLMPYEEI